MIEHLLITLVIANVLIFLGTIIWLIRSYREHKKKWLNDEKRTVKPHIEAEKKKPP